MRRESILNQIAISSHGVGEVGGGGDVDEAGEVNMFYLENGNGLLQGTY
jgi:hypothetical protein